MKIKTTLLSLLFLTLFVSSSYSQWSVDPNTNLPVCVQSGDQPLPKVAVTSDGGCYISWFDHRGSNYDMYLQRLNANGVPQFAANGILISNNPQNTSLVDYDMITDDSNNAIIAFTDIRGGSQISPFIYKISPAGTFLWGANGINLNTQYSIFQANPRLAVCTGNNIFVTWLYGSTPRVAKIQRLTPGGVKQFAVDGAQIGAAGSELVDNPSVVTSDNGSVIMLFAGYTGSFINPVNYRLYTQKISSNGGSVWNAAFDTVYSLGHASGFAVPLIYSDGNNGALYAWYDDRNSTSASTAYVQRINSAGTKLFPINGSAGNTTPGMVRNTQQACVMTSTNETYMFWKEANGGQTQFSMVGQRFDAAGNRMWTEAGLNVIPLSNNSFATCVVQAGDSNVYLYIDDGVFGSANNIVKAAKFNRAGTSLWNSGALMTIGSSTGGKSHMVGKINSNKMSIVSWEDQRSGTADIYAQNVNNNGTLGGPVGINQISSEIPGGYELKQNYPNPFNPSTKINYDLRNSNFVTLKIYDMMGKEVANLVNENQTTGSYSYTLDAGRLNLSSGIYYYTIQSGDFKDTKKMMLVK